MFDAEDINSAMSFLADQLPDLILLDWMLPGKSGVDFIRWLKKQNNIKDVPIIMLTAKAEEESKVKALMTGADDYITKPFSPQELIARIKVVLRRGILVSPDNEIKFKKMVLNVDKHWVKITGKKLLLTPIEYKILYFFIKHPGKTYTRDQLITLVWGGDVFIDDRTVDVQMRRLREKLKKFDYHKFIRTVRGTGYQFSEDEDE